jgi:L-ascorbate metabolism protein UlaG (beta-lactamase superfamily)
VDCDFILLSHAHSDHIGDAASIAARTGAAVIGVPEVLALCPGAATQSMNLGGSKTMPFGTIRMVPALHSSGAAGGIACGYVIYIGGTTVYYAGDTALFSDMKLIGQKDELDYAVLPIGDNFTMGLEDAALAAQWLNVKHVIPVHYNTWPVIAQDVQQYKNVTEAMRNCSSDGRKGKADCYSGADGGRQDSFGSQSGPKACHRDNIRRFDAGL